MKQSPFEITGEYLSFSEVTALLNAQREIALTPACQQRIHASRAFLDETIQNSSHNWYGINTGFGSLYNVTISPDAIERLQLNLIRSHAAGAGPLVPYDVSRIVLLLKILSFCPGNSGVSLELMHTLVAIFNAGLAPVMFQFGSLGASGDLAPLAHLALTVIGEGSFVSPDGSVQPADAQLKRHGISPIRLKSKEGLALINGTQFSTAYAIRALQSALHLSEIASISAACAIDAFNGNLEPFDSRIHAVRAHAGQGHIAAQIRTLLEGSEIASSGEKQLQDPYAFRCVPQVHGATWDVIMHCIGVAETELNAVTDNPLIFADSKDILSGGNFHGQPIALAMDYLALAIAELGSISERRTYQLLSGVRGLPDYLTLEAGVQSGYMIAQYTAASIVNRNKLLCTPASIDSIPSSKGQEDHVSMSANAASKLYELCDNVYSILAIELMTAFRALDFRKPARTSPVLERIRTAFRQQVPAFDDDHTLQPQIANARNFLFTWKPE